MSGVPSIHVLLCSTAVPTSYKLKCRKCSSWFLNIIAKQRQYTNINDLIANRRPCLIRLRRRKMRNRMANVAVALRILEAPAALDFI